jgi:CubicO group peptidase (beta-lactamase class C family)
MRTRRPLLGVLMAVVLLVPAAPAAAGSAVHPNHDDAALRAALTAVVDAGASGAITLVDDGDHVTDVAVGPARLEPRQPMLLRDQARVGSITKTVISTITRNWSARAGFI